MLPSKLRFVPITFVCPFYLLPIPKWTVQKNVWWSRLKIEFQFLDNWSPDLEDTSSNTAWMYPLWRNRKSKIRQVWFVLWVLACDCFILHFYEINHSKSWYICTGWNQIHLKRYWYCFSYLLKSISWIWARVFLAQIFISSKSMTML